MIEYIDYKKAQSKRMTFEGLDPLQSQCYMAQESIYPYICRASMGHIAIDVLYHPQRKSGIGLAYPYARLRDSDNSNSGASPDSLANDVFVLGHDTGRVIEAIVYVYRQEA